MTTPTDPLTALRAAFPLVTWTTQEGFGRDVYEGANASLDHAITVSRSLLMPRWHARCGPGTASMAEDPVVTVRESLTRLAARLRAQAETVERVLGTPRSSADALTEAHERLRTEGNGYVMIESMDGRFVAMATEVRGPLDRAFLRALGDVREVLGAVGEDYPSAATNIGALRTGLEVYAYDLADVLTVQLRADASGTAPGEVSGG